MYAASTQTLLPASLSLLQRRSCIWSRTSDKMASSTTAMTPEQAQAALQTLLEGPAMSPPAGTIPNFHDPPNLDAFVALTIALCVTFGTLAVVLRMYTKVFILRALAWEDCKSCAFFAEISTIYWYYSDVIVLAWVKWARANTEILF